LALLSALLSTTLGLNSIGRCDFVQAHHLGYGLFSVELDKKGVPDCEWWHQNAIEKFDRPWRIARVIGLIANLTGVLGLCALCYMACSAKLPGRLFQIILFLYVFCGILAMMTLVLALSSDICENFTLGFEEKCTFSLAGGISVGASLCYFLTAFFFFVTWSQGKDEDDI